VDDKYLSWEGRNIPRLGNIRLNRPPKGNITSDPPNSEYTASKEWCCGFAWLTQQSEANVKEDILFHQETPAVRHATVPFVLISESLLLYQRKKVGDFE